MTINNWIKRFFATNKAKKKKQFNISKLLFTKTASSIEFIVTHKLKKCIKRIRNAMSTVKTNPKQSKMARVAKYLKTKVSIFFLHILQTPSACKKLNSVATQKHLHNICQRLLHAHIKWMFCAFHEYHFLFLFSFDINIRLIFANANLLVCCGLMKILTEWGKLVDDEGREDRSKEKTRRTDDSWFERKKNQKTDEDLKDV